MPLSPQELDIDKLLQARWYYSVEIAPKKVIPGNAYPNVALTRKALGATDVTGKQVVDIGCMEGMLSTLAARRGAMVSAYDRWDNTAKIRLVQQAYGVEFDYVADISLAEYCRQQNDKGALFDVVLFSGVLYHMFDPFAGLARMRGLAHQGSLVIVETAAILANDMVLNFNDRQALLPHSNYFLPSVSCLESMLRFVGLRPIDCLYLGRPRRWWKPWLRLHPRLASGRICVVCRADRIEVLDPHFDPAWVRNNCRWDFSEFADLSLLDTAGQEVKYDCANPARVTHADGSIDLWKTVCASPPLKPHQNDLCLKLDDWR